MEKDKLEKYKCFLEQLRYDGGLLWRITGVFLLPNSIFLAFLLTVSFEKERIGSLGIVVAAIIGCVLSFCWLLAYFRSLAFYDFRMAEAREVEPSKWNLLKGKPQEFMNGDTVEIKEYPYVLWLRWYQKLKTRYAVLTIVILFLLTYLFILLSQLGYVDKLLKVIKNFTGCYN
ncbi:hypothetical protein ES702_02013 [subsurface metagenome]